MVIAPTCSNAIDGGLTTRQQWQERLAMFFLNIALTAALQLGCVLTAGSGLRGVSHFIIPAAILSQAAFLNLYPLALAALLAIFCGNQKSRITSGLSFGLAQCIVLTDFAAFRLFGLHFVKLTTLQLLTAPGTGDVFRPGTGTVVTMLFAYLLVFAGCLWLSIKVVPRLVTSTKCPRAMKMAFVAILGCLLLERTAVASRGLMDSTPLDSMEDTFTFYVPLDVTPLAKKLGWSAPQLPVALWDHASTLHLPKNALGPLPTARQPNILVITIESARADAFTPAIMPNTSRLADEGWRLTRHFSSGSTTPLGCFGIFYSLSVNYMEAVAAQQKPSPAIDYLRNRNYDFCLLSAAELEYSGLPKTAFRQLGSSIIDKWQCEHVDRDRLMTDKFLSFLDARKAKPDTRPFFGFLFFDASHLPYDYPPEDAVMEFNLKPGSVNYGFVLAAPGGSSRFKNSYLNSLHYVDRQIGRLLQQLRDSGEYNNTAVIITGDHGEEFGECGHFAHLDGLNRFQTQTLAALRLPGEPSRVVTNLTSHVDLFPTLFNWMGVTNAPSDYSTGVPIQEARPRSFVVVDLGGRTATVIVKKGSFTIFRPRGILYQNQEQQDLDPAAERATPQDIVELTRQYHTFFE